MSDGATYYFFHSTTMADNTQLPESPNTSLSSGSSAGTPPIVKNPKVAKGGKGGKGAYGKINFRLLLDHEHAFRLASVLLERAGDPVSNLQLMLDEAVGRYIDYLQARKSIDFQGIVPKKTPPIK